jgi:hypothetical protein
MTTGVFLVDRAKPYHQPSTAKPIRARKAASVDD